MGVLRFLTVRGAAGSLRGHVVFFQFVCSLPVFLIVTGWDYQEGKLTFGGALWAAFVSACAGLVMAIVAWHVVTVPILKRKGKL